ncbi:MAG TPA: VWA domain-containing protein [Solirubrobacteraceae bacterium]|nr:VWA domain-containing protein [Solirubrobacteraceae bacterium]
MSLRVGELAALLRAGGVRVGTGELLAAHRALAALDAGDPRLGRAALEATLCSGHDDLAAFAQAWASWRLGAEADALRAGAGYPTPPGLDEALRSLLPRTHLPGSADEGEAAREPVPAAWSEIELLLEKDFAAYSAAELELARVLLRRLATRGARRLTRRTAPSSHGHRLDVRNTLRDSLRTGGEPLRPRWRSPRLGWRRLILVVDVSGSMERYARMLLMYAQAAVSARRGVEAFAFSTSLRRISHELRGRDPDACLARATEALHDVHGGTRIGACLATLNRDYGRVVGRGAVVVLCSDGWDRGEPELLDAELGRLRRCAYRLVWLNPLSANPTWEPLTRGMAAAVPHVDHLLPGNSLRSLGELAGLLEGL